MGINSTIQKIIANNSHNLSPNDLSFATRIFGDGQGKYEKRLRAIEFSKYSRVLDAGCGFGQWSIELAKLNTFVCACDAAFPRITIARELAESLFIKNIEFRQSELTKLPYGDQEFDAIFCYGVIFLTPWRQSLLEFQRVLKPGGQLYVSANGLGWYIYLWHQEHNKIAGYDPREIVASAFKSTLQYERHHSHQPATNQIIEPNTFREQLIALDFNDISIAKDGHLRINEENFEPQPFFIGDYQGLDAVYEIIATRT